MDSLKRIAKMIRLNLTAFVSFELLFKVLFVAVFPPMFSFLFTQSLRLSGLRYLTAENLNRYLRTLLIYPVFFLLALLFVFFEIFEFAGIICLIDLSRRGQKTTFLKTIRYIFMRLPLLRRRSGFSMFFTIMLLTPAFHLATVISTLWSYSIFQRIWKMISRHWYFSLVITGIILLLLSLFLRWRYVCHYFVLEGCSAKTARARSASLVKEARKRDILHMLLATVLLSAVYLLLILAVLLISALIHRIFRLSGAGVSSFQVAFLAVSISLIDGLNVPVLFGMISIFFYRDKRQRQEKTEHVDQMDAAVHPLLHSRKVEYAILAGIILLSMFMIIRDSRQRYALRIQGLREVQVTAHRGASMFYPENTMPAFIGAVEQGCDWIELDVQESKDGVIFVMHDTNFLRTTGTDANTWDLTWDEISRLDAGSFFNHDYEGEQIPLFSDVLEFAKQNDVKLNIELKPTGHEKNLVGAVIDMVEEAGYEENCVITSQAYKVIEEVKQHSETMPTVYVMGLAFGAINRMTAADAFSIRATSISRSLVRNLHNRGIEIYAWTVDSRSNINRMIDVGVDNIITNNVPLAVECVNTSRTGNIIAELLRRIRALF